MSSLFCPSVVVSPTFCFICFNCAVNIPTFSHPLRVKLFEEACLYYGFQASVTTRGQAPQAEADRLIKSFWALGFYFMILQSWVTVPNFSFLITTLLLLRRRETALDKHTNAQSLKVKSTSLNLKSRKSLIIQIQKTFTFSLIYEPAFQIFSL